MPENLLMFTKLRPQRGPPAPPFPSFLGSFRASQEASGSPSWDAGAVAVEQGWDGIGLEKGSGLLSSTDAKWQIGNGLPVEMTGR